MELEKIERYFLEQKNEEKTKRDEFLNNVLDLSINAGKINKNANCILYSEESKEKRKEEIKDVKENIYQIIKNITYIANSLETSLEEIYKEIKDK